MRVVKKTYFDEEGNLFIKPYQLKDLAEIYEVCPRTVRRWIDAKVPEQGKKQMKYFTIEQVSSIVNALGVPRKIIIKQAA